MAYVSPWTHPHPSPHATHKHMQCKAMLLISIISIFMMQYAYQYMKYKSCVQADTDSKIDAYGCTCVLIYHTTTVIWNSLWFYTRVFSLSHCLLLVFNLLSITVGRQHCFCQVASLVAVISVGTWSCGPGDSIS